MSVSLVLRFLRCFEPIANFVSLAFLKPLGKDTRGFIVNSALLLTVFHQRASEYARIPDKPTKSRTFRDHVS